MYVCLCHSVTEKQIAEAVDNGASCLDDLSSTLKVADSCGRCRSCARIGLEKLLTQSDELHSQMNTVEA